MRTILVTTFNETLDYCFQTVVTDMLGAAVLNAVFSLLRQNGIPREDISERFDECVAVLTKALGASSRVLVHKIVTEIYNQYSQPIDFSFWTSLRDQLGLLKEIVTNNHLVPRREIDDPKREIVYHSKMNGSNPEA